jgi:hypothetical protein
MSIQDGEIKTEDYHIIFNGGKSLPGCPESLEEAWGWEKKANEGKDPEEEPLWKFDCGFKLDYDLDSMLEISSRFFPPKVHYGSKWDGTFSIYLFGEILWEKEFEEDTLEKLREQVEACWVKVRDEVKEIIKKETFKNL